MSQSNIPSRLKQSLLTMQMVQEALSKGDSTLYYKRLEKLPNDVNEFSESLENHGVVTVFPFQDDIKSLIRKSEKNAGLLSKIKEVRAEEKSTDQRLSEFVSVLDTWSSKSEPNQDLVTSLQYELFDSYKYLLTDESKFSRTSAAQISTELTNLQLYLDGSWKIRTKFNDSGYISQNCCTLLETSYTSNKNLKYINRTRKIGELLELMLSPRLQILTKNERPQLYNTVTGNRPGNNQYSTWNGLQVFDLDLKNSPDFGKILSFENVKEQLFNSLKHYPWLVCVGLSSSGKGIHIYTKVAKPHALTTNDEHNENVAKFWFRYSYLMKYAAVKYVLENICGIRESNTRQKVIDFSLAQISHGIKVAYDANLLINANFEDVVPQLGMHVPPVEGLELNDWLTEDVLNERTFRNWESWRLSLSNPDSIQEVANKSLEYTLNENSVGVLRPYPKDIFYQLRYNVCNTLADLFGEGGRRYAHLVLRSDECRNHAEVDNIYTCSVTGGKKATKFGIQVLKECGLDIELTKESKEVIEAGFKSDVENLLRNAVTQNAETQSNWSKVLNSSEYLGHYQEWIMSHVENGKCNLLISPPGVGKTELIKSMAKTKRVLLVLPYISVIDAKIITDPTINELFDVYYGSTSVDNIRKGRSAVMTIDKFSRLTPEKIAYLFDVIAIDESHLLFTSSFRIEAMSNALKNIKEFIGISAFDEYAARILCMTGTPTGEPIYFKYYNCLNTIYVAKNENRTKKINFVLCKNDDEKLANIAVHIAKSIKSGNKVLYPTNKGDIQATKLIGMVEYQLGRSVKWGYYKKSNDNSEMMRLINDEATLKEYELVLASNYLSVGIDINDLTGFDCVYDDSFAAFEIEQFNCRLRKVDINSTVYFALENNSGEVYTKLLNFSNFSIKMDRNDRNLVRDYVDISNKKMELSMNYDPITNRIYTPGFRVENGQIVFKLEEHELTLFEERYLETMRAPFFIAREMHNYGYEVTIQPDQNLIQDRIEQLIEVGLENAKIESEHRNEQIISATNWIFDNNEYHNSVGGVIDDLAIRIWKDNIPIEEDTGLGSPEVVETYLGDIEKLKVPNMRIFEDSLKTCSKLLGVYSTDTASWLFNEQCLVNPKKVNKAEVNRYIKLMNIIKSENKGTLGKAIYNLIRNIHEIIDDFEQDSSYSIDKSVFDAYIDNLTTEYLQDLELDLRTQKMKDKYRSEVSEMINTLCKKSRQNKGVRLTFRTLPTPDGKYVTRLEMFDATIVKLFNLGDSRLPEDLAHLIRMRHVENSEARLSADLVYKLKTEENYEDSITAI